MAVQNQLANRQNSSLTAYLNSEGVKAQINQVVGGKNGAKFISSIVSAYQATPGLRSCTNASILNAALLGEALKLSPSPQLGQYYMVPYKDKAQFILGYKGMVQLAIRSGYYRKLNVTAIKEGELVRYDPLEEEIEVNLIEDEEVREKTKTIGYYAMFEYENGFRKAIYWSRAKMEAHAKTYSKGYSQFWGKSEDMFDTMAVKTMLRQLISKWGIMSIDMQRAVEGDGKSISSDLSPDIVAFDEAVDNVEASVDNVVVSEQPYQEATAPQESAANTQRTNAGASKQSAPGGATGGATAPGQKVQDLVNVMAPPEAKSDSLPGQMAWQDEVDRAFFG